MELLVFDTYDEMSSAAANRLATLASDYPSPLICPASGNTPLGLYRELIRMDAEKKIQTSSWIYVGLDEWIGMNEQDPGSCRYMLNEALFFPLATDKNRIHFFDGRSTDLAGQCRLMDNLIAGQGGIDISILGLGMNGHIGFNEPGVSSDLRSHVIELDSTTQQVGQKYFAQRQLLEKGISIGLKTLREAGTNMLLVSGASKAPVLKEVLEGEKTSLVPASLLRDDSNLLIYADRDAASLLGK